MTTTHVEGFSAISTIFSGFGLIDLRLAHDKRIRKLTPKKEAVVLMAVVVILSIQIS
jgi:hypothetical protein